MSKDKNKKTDVNLVKSPYDENLIMQSESFLISVKLIDYFSIDDVKLAYDGLLSIMDKAYQYAKDIRKND